MDIGIDLGTTFSVIAVNGKVELVDGYPESIYLEDCDVSIIPSPDGDPTFPSVVVTDPLNPERFLYGFDALQQAEEGAAPVMFSKRKIGTNEPIALGDSTVVAREVATMILCHLKQCAERALGLNVERAVVTHPAYFDRSAVEETRQAAISAGFDVSLPEQLLMEPVAAALAYTRTDRRDPLRLLTYDLGGGTFDVAFLERREGVIHMRAFGGDHLLGGFNFDRALVTLLRHRLEAHGRPVHLDEADPDDRSRLARLLHLAEAVKIDLAKTPNEEHPVEFRCRNVIIDKAGRPIQVNERITRREFVELIRPYLNRTIQHTRDAIKKAGIEAGDIDEVLLVGGSTHGPWVADCIRAAFPGATTRLFHPDLCVGAGAAIHAGNILPALASNENLKLVLEVPECSVIPTVDIAGRVEGAIRDPVTVELRLPLGQVLSAAVNPDTGLFLFEDVSLDDVTVNAFVLTVRDPSNGSSLEHNFKIAYAPESSDTSTITTVIPRPLFVETLDGFVPIAREGQTLPAKLEASFMRVNNNRNIELNLFQEDQLIGAIRIESIPPEFGRDSIVHLSVVLTAQNELVGEASVSNDQTEDSHRVPVHIRISALESPSRDILGKLIAEWRGKAAEFVGDKESSQEKRLAVEETLAELNELLPQVPFDVQEIHAKLREIQRLLLPQNDPLRPGYTEIRTQLRVCRNLVALLKAEDIPVEKVNGSGDSLDAAMRRTVSQNRARAARIERDLDRLEKRAEQAHANLDHRSWGHVVEDLAGLRASLEDKKSGAQLPAVLLKAVAHLHVLTLVEDLAERLEEIENAGRLDDWRNEIVDLRDGCKVILDRIAEIDDSTGYTTCHARIRSILGAGCFGNLQERLVALGKVDVARA